MANPVTSSCKCGATKQFCFVSKAPCKVCEKCGTTAEGQPPVSHKWFTAMVRTDQGLKASTRCKVCYAFKDDVEGKGK